MMVPSGVTTTCDKLLLNLGAMKLIVTSSDSLTVALQLHIWVCASIFHCSQYIKKFPRPTNENFENYI